MIETEPNPTKQRMTKGARRAARRLKERRKEADAVQPPNGPPYVFFPQPPTPTFEASGQRDGWPSSTSWSRRRSR